MKYLSDIRIYMCLPDTAFLRIPNSKNLPVYFYPLSLLRPYSTEKRKLGGYDLWVQFLPLSTVLIPREGSSVSVCAVCRQL